MECCLPDSGITAEGLSRYIEEQIFTLAGVERPREDFSVLLTGSRAAGGWTSSSDIDIEVLCPEKVYNTIQRAMLAAGRIKSFGASLYVLRDENWQTYFGQHSGRPHFSLCPIDQVLRQLQEYDDVSIWIWTNAKVIYDPQDQFRKVLQTFKGYPRDVLVKKIKYRWMLAAYRAIEESPVHPTEDAELLPAAAGVLNAIHELYRFFFLVEGKPFPYTKRLIRYVGSTELGREFLPQLSQTVDLVLARCWQHKSAWDRLAEASGLICDGDRPECCRLEQTCAEAMLAAGVEPGWVRADFDNMNELLSGSLGPMP